MTDINKLLKIMSSLRKPETGCVWDKQQTYKTIVPHTIEEAYEVAEAVELEDFNELKHELGDLLFQVVFYSQIAKEDGYFNFHDVVESISEKMIRRHPHVFSDHEIKNIDEQSKLWDEIKQQEKAVSGKSESGSALDGLSFNQPAVAVARKIQSKAGKAGFDWPDYHGPLDKVKEEMAEVEEAIESGDLEKMTDELGDLLFASVNLCRKLKIDPEVALRSTNRKFERRFRAMESMAREEHSIFSELTLEEQETLWVKVKEKNR